MTTRSWLAEAAIATAVHGLMLAGLLSGFWDAGVCIVGILLDSLVAYAVWLWLYLRQAGRVDGDPRMLAKSFIGLSLGVWGFIGIFRTITLNDTALLAMNFAVLKYIDLSDLASVAGNVDEDGVLILLVILAALLLLVSLYFLAEILVGMPFADVASLAACVVALRVVEVVNYQRAQGGDAAKLAMAGSSIAELSLHVFVKGWIGALLMALFADSTLSMAWAYLVWSYAHALSLRPWLWRRFGPRLGGKMPGAGAPATASRA